MGNMMRKREYDTNSIDLFNAEFSVFTGIIGVRYWQACYIRGMNTHHRSFSDSSTNQFDINAGK